MAAATVTHAGRMLHPVGRRLGGLRPTDALLPLAFALWLLALRGIRAEAMTDFGLIPALPATFFVALSLLLVSFLAVLSRSPLSGWRLGLHLVVLVLILHGTTPAVFPAPDYTWVYKHFGVVEHISRYGSVDPRLDLYQNWPGFFALAAWFDSVAGVGSPLPYAAWAPVYFGLLALLAMAFAIEALTLPVRLRWLALFVFVSANWVGQDYFAPQAFCFGLSLTVIAAVLHWCRSERPDRWVTRLSSWVRLRLGGTATPEQRREIQEPGRRSRLGLLLALYAIFAAVVVSHQLTPYMVIIGVAGLTVSGIVRPRWIVLGLAAIAVAYLLTRLNGVTRQYVQLVSLNPFHNTVDKTVSNNAGLPGRVFAANAARALSLLVWTLAAAGAILRFRRGAPVLVPLVLMVSPVAIVFGQDYGGEATYRVFLFSLPWAAFLLVSCFAAGGRARGSARGDTGRRPWTSVRIMTVLAALLALFLPAYFGLEEVNYVRPTEVAASQFFYAHAKDGAVLAIATPYFPVRPAGNYDSFIVPAQAEPNLTGFPRFQNRVLTARDLPDIEHLMATYEGRARAGYLVISTGMKVDSQVFQVLPPGSLDSLDAALAASPHWQPFYRNDDVVIYELVRPPP
jgi:hypothetical protein